MAPLRASILACVTVLAVGCSGDTPVQTVPGDPEPATPVECDDFDLTGTVGGMGAGWFDIEASGVECDEVRDLLLADKPPNSHAAARKAGFTCAQTSFSGETSDYSCIGRDAAEFSYSFGS